MVTKLHREKQIEARLIKRVKEHGGKANKFTSPGRRSVPDRIVTMPCTSPPTFFVEAKAPGQVPTPSQEREHTRLRDAGGTVYWVDTYEGVDFLMASVCDGSCATDTLTTNEVPVSTNIGSSAEDGQNHVGKAANSAELPT